ncbi:MAG: hypothetical protein J6U54_24910 [Clostridiales bacterium]|nr:hypothetical protein [Clostridiales bacterium]
MNLQISNKWYNIIKYVSTTFIPALVVFLTVVGRALNLGWMDIVVMIIGAFGVFLGELIKGSSKEFWKNWKVVSNVKEKADDESGTG